MTLPAPPQDAPSEPVWAFFDVDGTLVATSAVRMYVQPLRRLGVLRRRDMVRLMGYSALYRLGLLPIDSGYRWLGGRLAGLTEEHLRAAGQRWFDEQLRALIFPGVPALLAEHRRLGHRLALLTAAAPYFAEPLAAALDIAPQDVLTTRLVADSGRLTGRVCDPICYGEGKVQVARAHLQRHGGRLRSSWFYSDSISDLPMLEAVDHPRVVHPDPRLARAAARRGWAVLDLRSTDPPGPDAGAGATSP